MLGLTVLGWCVCRSRQPPVGWTRDEQSGRFVCSSCHKLSKPNYERVYGVAMDEFTQPVSARKSTVFVAGFPGTCECGEDFDAGEEVYYDGDDCLIAVECCGQP